MSRRLLRARTSRDGIALIITLTVMALLLIMATAFVTNMRTERATAKAFTDQGKARQMALAGLHQAIAQLDRDFTEARTKQAAVATMGGRLYFASKLNAVTARDMFSIARPNVTASSLLPGNPAPSPLTIANLNGGNFNWTTTARRYLPIRNPNNPNSPSQTDITDSQINAQWTPVWATPDYDVVTSGARTPRRAGRFAFWVDDESCKVNLNNAFSRSQQRTAGWDGTGGIIEPVDGRNLTAAHRSSVDIAAFGDITWGADMLDPSRGIDVSRNRSGWLPMLTPEEVLGVAQSLTVTEYQLAKFALTTWSRDVENVNVFGDPRIDLSKTIGNVGERDALFKRVLEALNDPKVNNLYGGNPLAFRNKYPENKGRVFRQGQGGGSIEQIAANIVSYVSRNDIPACSDLAGNIPATYCGLRKDAHMNEIVASVKWVQIPAGAGPGPGPPGFLWELWAAVYVELINPYDVALPRSGEVYTIKFDGDIVVRGNSATAIFRGSIPAPTMSVNSAQGRINLKDYSSPVSAGGRGGPLTYPTVFIYQIAQAPVPSPSPPTINSLSFTLPQIRMVKASNADTNPEHILDWYVPNEIASPDLNLLPNNVQPTAVAGTAGRPPPESTFFEQNNLNRAAIGKNDPRTRVWVAENFSQVTVKGFTSAEGENITPAVVNYTGGDPEPTARGRLVNRSNFYMPEDPNRRAASQSKILSVGELGMVHTGRPWRSLAMQPMGLVGDRSSEIPDWALLDLFTVNTAPVHGRINVNQQGWHFGPINRPLPASPNLPGRGVLYAGQAPNSPVNLPLAALLYDASAGIRAAHYNGVLQNMLVRRFNGGGPALNANQPFFTIGEVCELYGIHSNPWAGTAALSAGAGNTTDANREDIIRRIANLITTRGNVFAIWVVGQSLASIRNTNPATDEVLGEARLMAIVERKNNTVTSTTGDGDDAKTTTTINDRFRILHLRWVSE